MRLSAEQLNHSAREHANLIARDRPEFTMPNPIWNPRGALGIYACGAAIAFRNVTVEPILSPH